MDSVPLRYMALPYQARFKRALPRPAWLCQGDALEEPKDPLRRLGKPLSWGWREGNVVPPTVKVETRKSTPRKYTT